MNLKDDGRRGSRHHLAIVLQIRLKRRHESERGICKAPGKDGVWVKNAKCRNPPDGRQRFVPLPLSFLFSAVSDLKVKPVSLLTHKDKIILTLGLGVS